MYIIKLTQSHHLALFLFEDICLKETMSLADSLYNLQLIQEFCQEYLNQCCHFTLEDMLYAASSIKVIYSCGFCGVLLEVFWKNITKCI